MQRYTSVCLLPHTTPAEHQAMHRTLDTTDPATLPFNGKVEHGHLSSAAISTCHRPHAAQCTHRLKQLAPIAHARNVHCRTHL
jgi:hypothetical protein